MNGDDVGKYNSARFKNWKNKGMAKFWSQLIFGESQWYGHIYGFFVKNGFRVFFEFFSRDRNCFSGHRNFCLIWELHFRVWDKTFSKIPKFLPNIRNCEFLSWDFFYPGKRFSSWAEKIRQKATFDYDSKNIFLLIIPYWKLKKYC